MSHVWLVYQFCASCDTRLHKNVTQSYTIQSLYCFRLSFFLFVQFLPNNEIFDGMKGIYKWNRFNKEKILYIMIQGIQIIEIENSNSKLPWIYETNSTILALIGCGESIAF